MTTSLVPMYSRGEVPVTVDEVALLDCDPSFSLHSAPAPDTALDPGDAAVAEVRFSGSTAPSSCVVTIRSTDADAPEQRVRFVANQGSDPRAGSDPVDDDGDGIAEREGDCDDANPDTYPGGPELMDGGDNDCDGLVDETTAAFDDDGDGFTELDLDCDDRDPLVSPGVVERCANGVDDDCDGLVDSREPCVNFDRCTVDVVGTLNVDRTAVEAGEQVRLAVRTHTPHGELVEHAWQAKDGEGTLLGSTTAEAIWTSPPLPTGYGNGKVYRLYWVGACGDERPWDFAEVHLYPPGKLLPPIEVWEQ